MKRASTLTKGRWKRVILPGNDKPVQGWQYNNFRICLNINNGKCGPGKRDRRGDYWLYEITEIVGDRERLVALRESLAQAKATE